MRKSRFLTVWNICLVLILTALLFGACAKPAPPSAPAPAPAPTPAPKAELPKTIVMGANPQGSIFYNIAVAMADLVGKHSPMKVELAPVGGSGYFPMFGTKEVDFAVQTVDEAWTGYVGEGQYKEPTQGKGYEIRTLLVGGLFRAAPMVLPDSGIRELKDVKGKRYTEMKMIYASTLVTRAILANAGLTWDDVIPIPVTGLVEQNDALLEGLADVTSAGIGGAQTQRLLAAGGYVLPLDDSEEAVARMQKLFPAYGVAPAPPPLIGLKKPAPVMTKPFQLLTRPGLSRNVIDALLDVYWNYAEELKPVHPLFQTFIPKNFASTRTAVPYSQGAINWYKARGLWTPELDALQMQTSK